jgi:hypothetical protein
VLTRHSGPCARQGAPAVAHRAPRRVARHRGMCRICLLDLVVR